VSEYARVDSEWWLIDRGAWITTERGPAWVDRVKRKWDDDGVLQVALGVVHTDNSTEWLVNPGPTAVQLLVPLGELAVQTVLRTLGGSVVVRQIDHLETRNTANARRAMRSHLVNLHRVWPGTDGETKDMATLLAIHAHEHASPQADWVAHVHVSRKD
jgi:hypothetical protein